MKIKRLFNQILSNFMFWYFILLLIIFLPQSLMLPSLSFRSAIVTAVGVDKNIENNEISVSILTLSQSSQGDNKENNKLVSSSSNTFASCVEQIETRLGRKLQMGHIKFIVISQDFKNDDISLLIDSVARTSKISNSVAMVVTNTTAKELLVASNELSSSSSYNLSEIISNDYSEAFTMETSIDYFYKGYLSKSGISTLGYIKMEDELTKGISPGSLNKTEDKDNNAISLKNTKAGDLNKNKVISYNRENVILRKGKIIDFLDESDMKGLNFITPEKTHQYLQIKNYTEGQQNLENADITFEILNKNISSKLSINKNNLFVDYDIKLNLGITEVISNYNNLLNNKIMMTDILKREIERIVKGQVMGVLNKLQNINADVFNLYQKFYINKNKEFLDYLKSEKDDTKYFQNITFNVNVSSMFS